MVCVPQTRDSLAEPSTTDQGQRNLEHRKNKNVPIDQDNSQPLHNLNSECVKNKTSRSAVSGRDV